jgi:prepilin-type N-terminal cleavage/methylation domain-containing protein
MEQATWTGSTSVERGNSSSADRHGQQGVTLIEILIVVLLIGILATLTAVAIGNSLQKARLARCIAELRSIQTSIYTAYPEDGLPDPETFWDDFWHGVKPGPYWYIIDNNDPNSGHGNDIDGYDEDNPGSAPRTRKDLEFILVCQHDHGDLAYYVYVEDAGPPTIADASNDPHYDACIPGATGVCAGPPGSSSPGGGKGKGKGGK